jgi:N-acetylglucosaminyldiphosphoundecaprenol N-acetyl-beta-D-mannosaminyltransferase
MKQIPKTTIFGVPFSKLGMAETVDYLKERIAQRKTTHVMTANPEFVMMGLEQPAFMECLQEAEMVVPDGTGIVWAASQKGDPVKERVPGYDLLHQLMAVGQTSEWKVYLLGAGPDVIAEASDRLKRDYPGIQMVGYRDGYFSKDEEEAIVQSIRETQPDLLFVGLGAPRQDLFLREFREQLQVPVMMGVGGSFDVIAGKVQRAPKAFQKLRLEWFHRLLKQPSRWRRMLALPKFAGKVLFEKDKL